MILLLLLHLLLLFLHFSKLLLLSLLFRPLVLQVILATPLTFLVLFAIQDPQYFLEIPLNLPTLGSHLLEPALLFLKLFPLPTVPYLPGLLLPLILDLSLPLSLSPWPGLGPAEDMAEDPEVLALGGEEPPGAEGAEPPQPSVARPLPFPTIFGPTISHLCSLLGVPLLMKP